MSSIYISRQPFVNRQSKIIANRLSLHFVGGATAKDAAHALNALIEYWPQGEKLVFISAGSQLCTPELLDWAIPENAAIEIRPASLLGDQAENFVAALRTKNCGLCLVFEGNAETALASGLQFRFIGFDARSTVPADLKELAIRTQPFGIGVAFNVYDERSFRGCLDAGVNAAASWFFKHPTKAPAKTLNPGHAQIVRVLNLVRKNADVKEIETALKQDVALSYKLLRYLNSASFGLTCEVQSFRHAVTILGYDKLNKWLSLLLATASKDPMAPALMHTALTRAHLMETLAHGLVDAQEYDNLFITGAFSMLDVLLGVSMDKALESMHLPENISDALLGRSGVYGPFLDLAKLSEGEDGNALAEQASMLGLSADHFNRAQIQALVFADKMEL